MLDVPAVTHDAEDSSFRPSGPFEGVPPQIVELCQSLTDFVERAVGIRPDYTPETLPLVDHYVEKAREAILERPEVLDLTAQALGAYFGEVARRSLVGFWRLPSPNFHDWQLCGQSAFVAINPIGIGYDALVSGQTHDGPNSQVKLAPEDVRGVADRLALLPPVSEDEYYTLSMRHEVLEIIYEAVRSHAMQRGYDETFYGADDYSTEMRPLDS